MAQFRLPVTPRQKQSTPESKKPLISQRLKHLKSGGRYWDRTSDPCRVKAVLYP